MKLRTKLLAPFGVALVLIWLLGLLVWQPVNLEHARQAFIQGQKSLLQTMEPDLARSLLNGDLAAVYGSLDYQLGAHRDDWQQLQLFDAHGKRLYPLSLASEPLPDQAGMDALRHRITREGEEIAELRLLLDWEGERSQSNRDFYLLQGMVLLILAVVMAAATYWQQRLIIQPIVRLSQVASRLAVADFAVTVPQAGADEIGTLTRSFETMRHNLMQAHENLLSATHKANAANVAKGQFLATMSHEIRTPMNGILGMGQMLLMPNLTDAERLDYARVIVNSGHTLLTLLNDILDLSKIEAGRLELELRVVDVQAVIQEVAALFSEHAQRKGLRMQAQWLGTDHVYYRTDPSRLRQMLSNLIGNAIKFTEEGSIRIEGCQVSASGERALLEFAVSDTGVGIPADKVGALFQPFTQADASITRKHGGTGLGLSIVRNLAELMDGRVGVESTVGVGTRMWFQVHLGVVNAGDERRAKARDEAPRATSAPLAAEKGFVLVVEDNLINRKVAQALLGKQGVAFQCVEDGQQALDQVMNGPRPALILMDCQMPVMDGFTATEKIRQWESDMVQARIPIVALTAGAFEEDRAHCFAVGMDDVLTKPLSVAALVAQLEKWLGRHPDQAQDA
jgi:signal transduction histidine kinase/CheY-like chemotaxis protein